MVETHGGMVVLPVGYFDNLLKKSTIRKFLFIFLNFAFISSPYVCIRAGIFVPLQRFMTMKKRYMQPRLEIMPLGTMVALCVSGEQHEGLGGGDNGGNPWDDGRAPGRVFF